MPTQAETGKEYVSTAICHDVKEVPDLLITYKVVIMSYGLTGNGTSTSQ